MVRAARLRFEALEAREVPALIGFDQLAIDPATYDDGHILVKWNDGLSHATRFTQAAENLGNGLFRLMLKPNYMVHDVVTALEKNASIAIVQPDYSITIARVANDPSAGSLWALNNDGQNSGTVDADIDAPEAWNTSTGTRRTIVAVIDTGVDYTHPDLKANIWRNVREIAGNGIDDDGNGFKDDIFGYDFANNDANPKDDNGHGTHVAGIIGAVGNNGIGGSGVNWNTQIMALKFLDANASGFLSNAVRAMNYAVKNGAKVINASFGGGGFDAAMSTAISNAKARGVIVVAAAGNSASNNDASAVYPASYSGDNLIAVAATDRNDKLASFSNYGKTSVDIAAPGKGIYSTLLNGKYGYYSGTSMAAPHVAGAISLVWDAHPTWTYRQVLNAVLATADAVPGIAGKVATGRLNVGDAINYNSVPAPTKDTAGATALSIVFSGTGSSIDRARVTFSESMAANTFSSEDIILTGPDGKKIAISRVTVVNGTGSTQFDITFATQSKVGSYLMSVGPLVRDLAGNAMDQNANGKNGEASDKFTTHGIVATTPTFSSTDGGKAIPASGTVVSTIAINQNITIADLNVRVNLSHTRTADLRLTLVAPDGTRVTLFNRRGGEGDDLTNTIFDDEATSSIYRGTAPFAGSFKPEYVLKALDGKNARGSWQLVVEDTAALNQGTLNSWSITIVAAGAGSASSTSAQSLPATRIHMLSAPPVNKHGQVFLGLASYFVRL